MLDGVVDAFQPDPLTRLGPGTGLGMLATSPTATVVPSEASAKRSTTTPLSTARPSCSASWVLGMTPMPTSTICAGSTVPS
jgi:hypothetical protein